MPSLFKCCVRPSVEEDLDRYIEENQSARSAAKSTSIRKAQSPSSLDNDIDSANQSPTFGNGAQSAHSGRHSPTAILTQSRPNSARTSKSVSFADGNGHGNSRISPQVSGISSVSNASSLERIGANGGILDDSDDEFFDAEEQLFGSLEMYDMVHQMAEEEEEQRRISMTYSDAVRGKKRPSLEDPTMSSLQHEIENDFGGGEEVDVTNIVDQNFGKRPPNEEEVKALKDSFEVVDKMWSYNDMDATAMRRSMLRHFTPSRMRAAFKTFMNLRHIDLTKFGGMPLRWIQPMTTIEWPSCYYSMETGRPPLNPRFDLGMMGIDACKGPEERILHIFKAALLFADIPQKMHKPFNSVLGETAVFKMKDQHPGAKPDGDGIYTISEHVSHHPPLTVTYTKHPRDVYKSVRWIQFSVKLEGLRGRINIEGGRKIYLPKYGETYRLINLPNIYWNAFPKLHASLAGKWTIFCEETGYVIEIEHKDGMMSTFDSSKQHHFTATMKKLAAPISFDTFRSGQESGSLPSTPKAQSLGRTTSNASSNGGSPSISKSKSLKESFRSLSRSMSWGAGNTSQSAEFNEEKPIYTFDGYLGPNQVVKMKDCKTKEKSVFLDLKKAMDKEIAMLGDTFSEELVPISDPKWSRKVWGEAIRELEQKNYDDAKREKVKVEVHERQLRAERKERGTSYEPRYVHQTGEIDAKGIEAWEPNDWDFRPK